MEIEILHEDEKEMEIVIGGENHTFSNLLNNYLQEMEEVTFSAYKIPHPLLDSTRPVLKVQTNGSISAREAIKRANERIISQVDELESLL